MENRLDFNDAFKNVSGKIYSTTDYKMFQILKGNRSVEKDRVNKIAKSIKDVGYITSPIVINEKFEVIDGQGRLAALESLGLPVEYVVAPGKGIEECISMNINSKNWSQKDYIYSSADQGNDNYIRLREIMLKYPKINLSVIATAAYNISKFSANAINQKSLVFTEETKSRADKRLSMMLDIFGEIEGSKYLKGNKTILQQSILYCLSFKEVNKNRLKHAMRENFTVPRSGWQNVEMCMYDIEEAYNLNLSKNNVVMIASIFRALVRTHQLRVGFPAPTVDDVLEDYDDIEEIDYSDDSFEEDED